MTAIVAGQGLGLFNTSLGLLGSSGEIGQAKQGANGDNVVVNAANGNLVIQQQDEWLAGVGLDASLSRTYNSQGGATDDNHDNWQLGLSRRVTVVNGVVTRTAEDGAQTVFNQTSAGSGIWVSHDGGGSYDTMTTAGNSVFWTSGTTRVVERYDLDPVSGAYLLTKITNPDGKTLSLTYTNRLITQITTTTSSGPAENVYIDYYTGTSNISQLRTVKADGSTFTRVHYTYDINNRLQNVIVDLSPQDNSTADGNVFQTTYSYVGSTTLIAGIKQSTDGVNFTSDLEFTYNGNRIQTITDHRANATDASRQITFAYGTGQTLVTDALGNRTLLTYDTSAAGSATAQNSQQLLSIASYSTAGAILQSQSFSYDSNGNVAQVTDGKGNTTHYLYDAQGNRIYEVDASWHAISRTFNAQNQVLTQTTYTTTASATTLQPTTGLQTTRYVYDDGSTGTLGTSTHLRFVITPDGGVTQNIYNAAGQLASVIQYVGSVAPVSSLGAYAAPTEAQMMNWVGALTTLGQTTRTDYAYDFRGNLQSKTQYATVNSSTGTGVADGTQSTTYYIYDQAGNLLKSYDPRYSTASQADQAAGHYVTQYIYDGLNRVTATADGLGNVTQISYQLVNQSNATVVTRADGSSTVTIYDAAGHVTASYVRDASSNIVTGTTYQYDGIGQLRASSDLAGQTTYFIYDEAGRKVGTLDPTGALTEYCYDAAGKVIETIAYATLVSSTTLAALLPSAPTSGAPFDASKLTLANLRPNATPLPGQDRVTYQLYDDAGRLAKSIDAAGALTDYQYDGAGRLVSTLAYSKLLNSGKLAAIASLVGQELSQPLVAGQTRPWSVDNAAVMAPATAQTPGAASVALNGAADRLVQQFYNAEGQVVGILDAQNYYTQNEYDVAGRLKTTTRYANTAQWPAGAAQTPTVTPDPANDQSTSYYYDASGRVTGMLDAMGYLTVYQYDLAGNKTSETRYATPLQTVGGFDPRHTSGVEVWIIATSSMVTLWTPPSTAAYCWVPIQPANAAQPDHQKQYLFDADNRLIQTTSLPDGLITQYGYDTLGHLTSTTTALQSATDQRTTFSQYDAAGHVVAEYSGQGYAALLALGANPTAAQLTAIAYQYATRYIYNTLGQCVAKITPDGSLPTSQGGAGNQGNVTLYYYDPDGRLKHTVTVGTLDASGKLIASTAVGAVLEYTYDAFGDQVTQRQYGNAVSASLLSQLLLSIGSTGAGIDGSVPFSAVADTTKDSVTAYGYDLRGHATTIATVKDAPTTAQPNPAPSFSYRTYDAFGQLQESLDNIDPVTNLATFYEYDQGGHLLAKAQSAPQLGARLLQKRQYDAFGRVVDTFDSQNGVSIHQVYDQLGRQVSVTDRTGATTKTTYDAFGRQLSVTDPLNNQTVYAYNDAQRLMTVSIAVGSQILTTTTQMNLEGQAIAVMDARGNVTKYQYNQNGQLTDTQRYDGTTGALLTGSHTDYDSAGRAWQTVDARGVLTQVTFDAANRELTRVVDAAASGLQLTTQYIYDAKGQVVWTQAPNGVWTNTQYDLRGDALTVTVDPIHGPNWQTGAAADNPNGLNLTTSYTYDQMGRTLTVTEGAGSAQPKVTQYVYDEAGRRVQEIIDPSPSIYDGKTHLNLTTNYTYDYNDNVVAKQDANGNVTRYVYDNQDRLIYSVDPSGSVIQTEYDADGRVSRTTAFATQISVGSAPLALTSSFVAGAIKGGTADQVTVNVYDSAGRLTYTVDALNDVTQRSYDAVGNLLSITRFANTLQSAPVVANQTANFVSFAAPVLAPAANATLTPDSTRDQVTQYVYDAANRATWTLQTDYDTTLAQNKLYVTQTTYDNNSNVIQTRRYASVLQNTFVPGVAPLLAAPSTGNASYVVPNDATDRVTNTIYDAANRAAYIIDPEKYVTQNLYDQLGHLTSSTRAANPLQNQYVAGVVPLFIAYGATPPAAGGASYVQLTQNLSGETATGYLYDNAGRLIKTTDAETNLTKRAYDATGRLTDITVCAADGSNASTTHYVYDLAGRLTDEIKGYRADGSGPSQSDYADTRYILDGVGNRVGIIDPRGVELAEGATAWALNQRQILTGSSAAPAKSSDPNSTYAQLLAQYTTIQVFDGLGHVTQSTDPTGGVTATTYDAFGNAVKITDPNTNNGYFYFNKLNQAVWRVDPNGYATQTHYNAFGQVDKIVKYVNAIANPGALNISTPPTVYTSGATPSAAYLVANPDPVSGDQTTLISHDLLGRQTTITDAAGGTESMSYDALGNKISYTNKLNGTYKYTYDRVGNLLTETLPVQVYQYNTDGSKKTGASGVVLPAVNVVNVYTYDSRGNRLTSVEANLLQEQRKTTYSYDRLNRMVTQSGQSVTVYTASGQQTVTVTPTQKNIYDARGNLIESDAADGARSLTYYDSLNRKIAEVNAVGVLTTYGYNEGGDLLVKTVFGNAVSLPQTPGGTPPVSSAPTNCRTTYYTYDNDHRLLTTTIKGIETGQVNLVTGNYEVKIQDLTTSQTYDHNGNVTSQTDARGNTTWNYYDAVGNKIAQVDANRYLTVLTYDANGNVVDQKAYANKLPDTTVLTVSSSPSGLAGQVSAGGVRETKFVRDTLGRVLKQTVVGVNSTLLSATDGSIAGTQANADTSFQYDALGDVTQRTEATGDILTWTYDKVGRETENQGAVFTDVYGNSGTRQTTDSEYNGLGLKVLSIERGDASHNLVDRVTVNVYGVNGWLNQQADAQGYATWFQYDASGRVRFKSISRQTSNSASTSFVTASNTNIQTDVTAYTYDFLGRQTKQVIYNFQGYNTSIPAAPSASQTIQTQSVQYNSFGEITGKSTYGGLVAPTAWQESTIYDNAGHAISTNAGTGVTRGYLFDANGNTTLKIESTGTDLTGLTIDQMLARSDVHLTISTYDGRNQLLDTYEPTPTQARAITQTVPLAVTKASDSTGVTVSIGALAPISTIGNALSTGTLIVGAASSNVTAGFALDIHQPDGSPFGPSAIPTEDSDLQSSALVCQINLPRSYADLGAGNYQMKIHFDMALPNSTAHIVSDQTLNANPLLGTNSLHAVLPFSTSDQVVWWSSPTNQSATYTVSYSIYKRTSDNSDAIFITQGATGVITALQDYYSYFPAGTLGRRQTLDHNQLWSNYTKYNNTVAADHDTNIYVAGQPQAAYSSTLYYRLNDGSNSAWMSDGTSGLIPGQKKFGFDGSKLFGGNYQYLYVTADASGNIVNSQSGVLDLRTSTPQITVDASSALVSNKSFFDTTGKINVILRANSPSNAVLKYRVHGTSGAWVVASVAPTVFNAAGSFTGLQLLSGKTATANAENYTSWYQFSPAALNAASGQTYDYILQAQDSSGVPVKVLGQFALDSSGKVTPSSVNSVSAYSNLPQQVHFQNLPIAATRGRILYRKSSSSDVWTSVDLSNDSPGSFTWNAVDLGLSLSTAQKYDFQFQSFDSNGRQLTGTTGSVTLSQATDATGAVLDNSSIKASTDGSLLLIDSPSSTQAVGGVTLYYRNLGGTTFNSIQATKTAGSNGTLDSYSVPMSSLTPSSISYEYYYVAYASDGTTPLAASAYRTGVTPPTAAAPARVDIKTSVSMANILVTGVGNSAQVSHHGQTYDAYGDVATQTDALGHTTTLQYNALGDIVEKDDPQTSITMSNGYQLLNTSPKTTYYYDAQGRLIGELDGGYVGQAKDANNYLTTYTLRGAGKGARLVSSENHFVTKTGLYSQKLTAYDRFGDVRRVTDEMGFVTDYAYDNKHELTNVLHALRTDGANAGLRASDSYVYDAEGNRITHTTGPNGSLTYTDKTDYDALGRVLTMTSAANSHVAYKYLFINTISAMASHVTGGWRKTTVNDNSANNTLIDDTDIFGHLVTHTDLSNRVFTYAYNGAGWLTGQTGSNNQNISYSYYANGRVEYINDNGTTVHTITAYEYDQQGNKTFEGYATVDGSNYIQQTQITYDELNRIKTISDPQYNILYEYDARGNKRHLKATNTSNSALNQDLWYDYDSLNRFTVSMGRLINATTSAVITDNTKVAAGDNNVIDIGLLSNAASTGVGITYDKASHRTSAHYASNNSYENYSYTTDGFLTTVKDGSQTQLSSRSVDLLGRVTEYVLGATSDKIYTYLADGRTDTDTENKNGIKTTYHYNGDGTIQYTLNSQSAQVNYVYDYWDTAKQLTIKINAGWQPGFSQFFYDVNGHITQVVDNVAGRTLQYENNAQGEILIRNEIGAGGTVINFENYYYVDGNMVGESGNAPDPVTVNYAQALAEGPAPTGKDRYKNWSPIQSANNDQNFQAISSSYPSFSATTYVVNGSSETLATIARSVWGDSSMWYLLAEANGLSSNATLKQGQTLTVPNKVTNVHNSSQTHMVYDAGAAMGDTSPTLPDPPPPPPADDGGCGTLGTVVMVVVAIVATVATAGAATAALGPVLAGALGGAVGSIASQAVGMAMGNVKQFSWSSVAMGAIGGGVTAGVGEVASGLAGSATTSTASAFMQGAMSVGKAIASSVVSQELDRATGLQHGKFDWSSVAAAGITAEVAPGAGPSDTLAGFGQNLANGLVEGGLHAALAGQRPDWAAIAANSFGSALGDSVVGNIAQQDNNRGQQQATTGGAVNMFGPLSFSDVLPQPQGVPILADEFVGSAKSGVPTIPEGLGTGTYGIDIPISDESASSQTPSVGVAGKEAARGAWGIAESLAGPGASKADINTIKNQLLTLNPELAGPIQQGQPYRVPTADTPENLTLAQTLDARYQAQVVETSGAGGGRGFINPILAADLPASESEANFTQILGPSTPQPTLADAIFAQGKAPALPQNIRFGSPGESLTSWSEGDQSNSSFENKFGAAMAAPFVVAGSAAAVLSGEAVTSARAVWAGGVAATTNLSATFTKDGFDAIYKASTYVDAAAAFASGALTLGKGGMASAMISMDIGAADNYAKGDSINGASVVKDGALGFFGSKFADKADEAVGEISKFIEHSKQAGAATAAAITEIGNAAYEEFIKPLIPSGESASEQKK